MDFYIHLGVQKFRYKIGRRTAISEYLMELYLQFGWGMMAHCKSLISAWGGGTVILSPRDLSHTQLVKHATEIKHLGGNILLDPQFYLPHDEHFRLRQHEYWPNDYSSGEFWGGSELTELLGKLAAINRDLETRQILLPGVFASEVNDGWVEYQALVIDEANRINLDPDGLLATVALSGDVTRNDNQIQRILDEATSWDVAGVYLVCEHPNGNYLVSDPNWLANVIDLIAGFRLIGKSVVLGYCNQQMLIAASAGANAIASGTWMNVRSFPPSKFRTTYEDEIKQRTTWYYCPQSMSEYKIAFLDIAKKQGVLDLLKTPDEYDSNYSDNLFSGPQPSAVPFSEQSAFRHYLQCLRWQTMNSRKASFDETVDFHEHTLANAEGILNTLRSVGVNGQLRDFKETIDINRAALSVLRNGNGPRLRRYWADL